MSLSKTLALDVSSKTGYALFEDDKLVEYGLIKLPNKIVSYGFYPAGFLAAAIFQIDQLMVLIRRVRADRILIEETNPGGRAARYDQKYLEYLHALLMDRVLPEQLGTVHYISSSDWRNALGLKLDKAQRKNNQKASAAGVKGTCMDCLGRPRRACQKCKGTGKLKASAKDRAAAKAVAGVKGKITVKHLAVEHVNAAFNLGFKIKDNDVADAICLKMAFDLGVRFCEGKG